MVVQVGRKRCSVKKSCQYNTLVDLIEEVVKEAGKINF